MNFDWLQVCAEGQTTPCVAPVQVVYLIALLVGVVLFALVARRSRDLTTGTLVLMAVAIAINIAVGSITVLLRLPIYLDSIGTVLVGALAGPWAGALTGILANLIWSILPIPGGGGPTIAFYAPVAGVIGLMAGFWASRGVFQLRADDARVGGFLSLAAGIVAAGLAFLVVQIAIGIPDISATDPATALDNQGRFVLIAIACVAIGAVVAWVTARTVFAFRSDDPRIRSSLVAATSIAAFALVFALFRLLFSPSGYFSGVTGVKADGTPDSFLGGANLTALALPDPVGLIAAIVLAVVVGYLAWTWARRGDNARLFPVWIGGATTGLIAASISAPISAGVFGGVTGAGTDALVALFRTLGLGVFQSAFAQGLTSDPLDKTISYTIVFAILGALPITVRTMYSRGEATVAE
jgi:energy-coupling factor transport system substrate-specific component